MVSQQAPTQLEALRDYLQQRLNPTAVASLDARVRLAWPAPVQGPTAGASASLVSLEEDGAALVFELHQGNFRWLQAHDQAQATFWFRDAQDLTHLLSDSDAAYADFMQRFMAAELSSDGYLPWAFTLLSLFRGGPGLRTPS